MTAGVGSELKGTDGVSVGWVEGAVVGLVVSSQRTP